MKPTEQSPAEVEQTKAEEFSVIVRNTQTALLILYDERWSNSTMKRQRNTFLFRFPPHFRKSSKKLQRSKT